MKIEIKNLTKIYPRGKKKALKSLVEYMKAIGDEVEKYPIYLAHSDADEILDELQGLSSKTEESSVSVAK